MRRRDSLARLVVAACAACAGAAPAHAIPNGSTVLVDVPPGVGALPFDGANNSTVGMHALSANACFVVFSSQADSLSATDENAAGNVFRLDRCSPGTPLVQVNTTGTGTPAGPGSQSRLPTVSANGRFVAFVSNATNLSPAATTGREQAYVKDLETGSLRLVSRGTGAGGTTPFLASDAVITGDGTKVVFSAFGVLDAENVDGSDQERDLYVRDLAADTTRMVSLTTGNAAGHGVNRFDVNHTGTSIAFTTTNRLDPVNDTATSDSDVYARRNNATELLSDEPGADSANRVAVSTIGSQIAFSNGQIWKVDCIPACLSPARQDEARSGGANLESNDSPFFARTDPSATASRLYWVSESNLDPADTNAARDIYARDLGVVNPDTAIHLMTGGDLADGVPSGDATDDGALVVFQSFSDDLPGTGGQISQVFTRNGGQDVNISQPAGQPARVLQAGTAFLSPLHAISDDGRFVSFASRARALGAGPFVAQAFVRDVVSGSITMASVATDGGPANASAFNGSLAGGGGRVAFVSEATNLVPGVTDGLEHVYVRDLATGVTSLVDRAAAGGPSNAGAADPQISGDGSKVVFISSSSDLPEAPPGGMFHAYRADLASGTIVLVDRSSSGEPADKGAASADVSGDGNRVAFQSSATNLGGGTAAVQAHIYVRDLAAGTTTWVSVPESGDPAVALLTVDPSISRDGNRVAFRALSDQLGFGAPADTINIFVRDIAAGSTTLASTSSQGAANGEAFNPVLSGDGSKVAFATTATNMDGAHDGLTELFIRDLAAGATRLGALRDGTLLPGRRGSFTGSLNFDGSCVAFSSLSDDLVAGGYGPDFTHIFLHALSADCPFVAADAAPVVRRFRMLRKHFRLARNRTPRVAAKRGTAFLFSLSENAATRIKIARELPGRRRGSRCVKPRRGLRRKCVRLSTVGTLTRRRSVAGANRVKFSGRIGRRALRRGRYRATLVATDAAGNRSTPRSVKFRIVRR